MFVNGDAIRGVVWMLAVGPPLLCLTLVAHGVWVARLARSPALAMATPGVRTAALVLAAVTPVLGFHVARFAPARTGGGSDPPARAAVAAVLPGLVGLLLLALAFLAASVLRAGARGIAWGDLPARYAGILLVCGVLDAMLVMICRVLLGWSERRSSWTSLAATAVILEVLVA